jgi:hypothetical protein
MITHFGCLLVRPVVSGDCMVTYLQGDDLPPHSGTMLLQLIALDGCLA